MAKRTFSESEMYLLKNWTSVCRMEDVMNAVRKEKYAGIVNEAGNLLWDRLGKKEYDLEVYPTQNWGDGFICFWLKIWENSNSKGEVPYFRLGGLRLEHLLSDDAPSKDNPIPYACLDTRELRKAGQDLAKLRERLKGPAKQILKEIPHCSYEDEARPISYSLPEGRVEVRRLLFEDEQGFSSLLISNCLRLADLAPIVTRALIESKA